VKGRSITELLREILEAQSKVQAERKAAEAEVVVEGDAPAADAPAADAPAADADREASLEALARLMTQPAAPESEGSEGEGSEGEGSEGEAQNEAAE